MNEVLKQRLVGALILVALGVIFWPIIFVQPDERATVEPGSIPQPPEISVAPIEAPGTRDMRTPPEMSDFPQDVGSQDVDAIDEVEPAPEPVQKPTPEPVAKPAERTTRTEAPEKLAVDGDGVPVAWTLQVATLSSSDKAEALRRRLLDLQHKAYIVSVHRDGRTLYRVCVGPKFERAELDKLKASIDSTFGVKSLVARYVP